MKISLISCTALLLVALNTNAQLAMETFNGVGLPVNWVMVKVDNNIPNAVFDPTIVTNLTTNAWMKWPNVAAGDSSMLTVSYFSTPGTADRWLMTPAFTVTDPNMIIKWQDLVSDPAFADVNEVWVSPTAGITPASYTVQISNLPGGSPNFTQRGAFIGNYNGQTIRLAFRDHSTDKYTLQLDNVGTAVPTYPVDGAVDSVIFATLVPGTSASVSAIVSNQGAQNLNSVQVQYTIDAGPPVVQTFPVSLQPYATQTINFTTPAAGLTYGSHTLAVTLLQSNGTNDANTANNTRSKTFAAVDPATSVSRNGIMEEFASSTAVTCATFNQTFDPLILANNANTPAAHFNVIKYEMNWPAPGNDQSYNNGGIARRTYYNCNAIPEHFTNGLYGGAGDQAEITASQADPAFMTIAGTYSISGNMLFATAVCTPKFTITGANFTLYMVSAERHYTNPNNTNGELNYYFVERTMFPNENGTAIPNWVANTSQTFSYSKTFVNGNPAQLNDNFWIDATLSDLVIFVQDNSDQSILQSMVVAPAGPLGVKELNGISDMAISPNPAVTHATLGFSTTEAQNIDISVVDVLGRTVYSYSQKFDAGAQRISIPLGDIVPGIYNVRVQTANGVATQRLTVAK